MEILTGVFIAIGFIFIAAASRIITITVHELGHALPSLLFTNGDVEIHVGSFGDNKDSFKIDLGRLKAFFKLNILQWNSGLCSRKENTSLFHSIIIVLGGPFFSLMLGGILFFILKFYAWGEVMTFIFAFFIISSVYDFFVNIIPLSTPILLADGSVTYNDGTHFLNMIKASRMPEDYNEGLKLQQQQKHDAAIEQFKKAIAEGHNDKQIHFSLIDSLSESGKLDQALKHVEFLQKNNRLVISDYSYVGNILLQKENYRAAIQFFNQYLYKHFNDTQTLNKRGYAHLRVGDYQNAYYDFNSAILQESKFAAAYNNRGLARIRLGDPEGGLEDIEKSKSMDDSNPFVYLHLGYYFKATNQTQKAVKHFQKAKDMGIDFHGLDYLIETT